MHRLRSKIPCGLIKEEWREEQALKVRRQKILMKEESVSWEQMSLIDLTHDRISAFSDGVMWKCDNYVIIWFTM